MIVSEKIKYGFWLLFLPYLTQLYVGFQRKKHIGNAVMVHDGESV